MIGNFLAGLSPRGVIGTRPEGARQVWMFMSVRPPLGTESVARHARLFINLCTAASVRVLRSYALAVLRKRLQGSLSAKQSVVLARKLARAATVGP